MTTRRLNALLTARDRATPVIKRVRTELSGLIAVAGVGALAGGAAISGLVRSLAQQAAATVRAAAEQQQAVAKLDAALAGLGDTSRETTERLQQEAGALQQLTGVGDETILTIQQIGLQSGVNSDEVTKFTGVAIDFAKALRLDVNSAALLVSKAVQGNVSSLTRYGIVAERGETVSETLGNVMQAMGSRLGFAERAARNLATQSELLENNLGDVRQAIGGPFVTVIESATRNAINPFVAELATGIQESKAFKTSVLGAALAMAQVLRVGEQLVRSPAVQIGLELFLRKLENDILKISGVFQVAGSVAAAELRKTLAVLGGPGESPIADAIIADIVKSLGGVGAVVSETVTPAQKGLTEEVKATALAYTGVEEAIRQMVEVGASNFETLREAGLIAIEPLKVQFGSELRDAGVSSLASIGDAAVDAAAGAEVAWDRFLRSLLADVAKAIVRATVLRGILAGVGGGGGGTDALNPGLILGGFSPFGFQHGAFIRQIAVGARGRDSVPARLTPEELVVPAPLTRLLTQVAERGLDGGGGGGVHIEQVVIQEAGNPRRTLRDLREALGLREG